MKKKETEDSDQQVRANGELLVKQQSYLDYITAIKAGLIKSPLNK